MERLSDLQLATALQTLPGWQVSNAGLERDVKFESFSEAFAFITEVAMAAAEHNHHPDWSNSFTRVSLRLTTHDAGGLTRQDIDMANVINRLLARRSSAE